MGTSCLEARSKTVRWCWDSSADCAPPTGGNPEGQTHVRLGSEGWAGSCHDMNEVHPEQARSLEDSTVVVAELSGATNLQLRAPH